MDFKFCTHGQRLFVPAGAVGTIASNGLTAEPSRWRDVPNHRWEDVADVPCLVVLGDPSIGKSTELKHQHQELVARGELSFYTEWRHWSSGLDLEYVRSDPPGLHQALAACVPFTWFIDALDEGRLQANEAFGTLMRLLTSLGAAKQLDRLKLRLSCRTAEWRASDFDKLEGFYPSSAGSSGVKAVRILPLSEAAVRELALEKLVDAFKVDRFMAECDHHSVLALAGHPMLLATLLDEFQRSDRLGRDRTELYGTATRRLASEVNLTHLEHRSSRQHVGSRLDLARYIGARLVLSAKQVVSVRDADEDVGILQCDDLAANPTALDDALATPLFSEVQQLRFQFYHRSFMEFSAAEAFAQALAAGRPLRSLLPAFPVSEGGIPTELRETAGWLASMDKSFQDWLVQHDVEAACGGDTRRYSAENRLQLVHALAERFKAREYQAEFSRFGDLAHDIPEGELRQLLELQNGPAVRSMAFEMIAGTKRRDLMDVLAERVLDASEVAHLRTRAVEILSQFDSRAYAPRLRTLLRLSEKEDPEDDIAGAVLFNLYPNHISLIDALSALHTPRRPNHLGYYRMFWTEKLWTTSANFDDGQRELVLSTVGDFFDKYGRDSQGVRSHFDFNGEYGTAIVLRKLFDRFTALLAEDLVRRLLDAVSWAPRLQAAFEWSEHYGADALSKTAIVAVLRSSKEARHGLIRWAVGRVPAGRNINFYSDIPYFDELAVVDDFDLYTSLARDSVGNAKLAVAAFSQAVRLSQERACSSDVAELESLSGLSNELKAAWQEATFIDFEHPLAQHHRKRLARMNSAATGANLTAPPSLGPMEIDALRRGDVAAILQCAHDLYLEVMSNSVVRDVKAKGGEQVGEAFEQGALHAWRSFNQASILWKPWDGPSIPLPNAAIVAGFGFWAACSEDQELNDLTDAQIELMLWLTLHGDAPWRPLVRRVWAARPQVVWARIESLLSHEQSLPGHAIPRLWSKFMPTDELPDSLVARLKDFAARNLLAKGLLVRRAMYAFLWHQEEHAVLLRAATPALEHHLRTALYPTTSAPDEAANLVSFAFVWLLDSTVLDRMGNDVFCGPSHFMRALSFVGGVQAILHPNNFTEPWETGFPVDALAKLIPYLYSNNEPTEVPTTGTIDAGTKLARDARNRAFARIAAAPSSVCLPLFRVWKDDDRYGSLRPYLAHLYAQAFRQQPNEVWKPLSKQECDAVLLRKGALVRSRSDVVMYVDDIIESKLAGSFRTDYGLTPLLWGKKGNAGSKRRHNDEKDVQTAVYFSLRTLIQVSPLVGAREPEQFDAKKPDARLSFLLQSGEIVHVPIEIKWSDNVEVWTAIEEQLLAKYMGDAEITFGIYIVAWAGLGEEKEGPDGTKPASPEEMLKQLHEIARRVSQRSGKTISAHLIDVSVPMPPAPAAAKGRPRKPRSASAP